MKESEDFLKNPKLLEHYSLLQELGLFDYIETFKHDVRDYKNLLAGAADIFKQTSIDDMLDVADRYITDAFLPSFIVFIWEDSVVRDTLVIKGYRNLKPSNFQLPLFSIRPFSEFFLKYPGPISYDLFEYQLGNNELTAPLSSLTPEIIVPVIGPSGLYGLILVGDKVIEGQYSPRELSFLDRLIAYVSVAIQNHLHYEHSVRDPKTGLFNHGFFMSRLTEELARCVRTKRQCAIIVIDVDFFKKFNDGFGHLAGDKVLEKLAQVLHTQLRREDTLSRFGGEEFTVLIPEMDREGAWAIAERLRIAVSEAVVDWPTPLPRITISLGVACFLPTAPCSPAEIIQRADAALYSSKQRGRNRTTLAGGGLLFLLERHH